MTDEEINKFHTSLREVLLYIKYSKDKKKLHALVASDERFKTLERTAAEVIKMTTKTEIEIDESEDEIDMCQAIREMQEEMWEAGMQTGIENTILSDIKNVMEAFGVTAEKAMRSLKVPEDEFDKYYEKLNA